MPLWNIPPVRPRETCSTYWDRLTPEERAEAVIWRDLGGYVTMTAWMLARGCSPVAPPMAKRITHKPQPRRIELNAYMTGARRRIATSPPIL